jgi:hypothetical protein
MTGMVPVLVVVLAYGEGARATSLHAGTSDDARAGTAFPLGVLRLLYIVAVPSWQRAQRRLGVQLRSAWARSKHAVCPR